MDPSEERESVDSRIGTNSRTIAKLAGVSQATVSRVLNNHPNVRDSTRQRVLEAIDELQYIPNMLARNLVTQRTTTIGLLVSNVTNPFYPEVFEAVHRVASSHEMNLMLCNTDQHSEKQEAYLRILLENRVAGIVVTSAMLDSPFARKLAERGFPIVFVNRYMTGRPGDSVCIDNFKAGFSATNHLKTIGHTSIGYLGGTPGTSTNTERERGYLASMSESRLQPRSLSSVDSNFTWEWGYRSAHQYLHASDPVTAMICADDLTALGFMDGLYDAGRRVPKDCAVVGFDNARTSRHRMIGLTTIHQPVEEMAITAMEMLLSRISGEYSGEGRHEVLPAELMVRATCGANPEWYVHKDSGYCS